MTNISSPSLKQIGAPVIAAAPENISLYFADRPNYPATARWAVIAPALIVISLGAFFAWIYPANHATESWVTQPDNWKALRRDWKLGHAANAILVGFALLAAPVAIVRRNTE